MSRIEKESPLVPEKQVFLFFRDQGTLFFYGANAPHLGEWIRGSNPFSQMAPAAQSSNHSPPSISSLPLKIFSNPSKKIQFPFIIHPKSAYDINSKVMKT